MKDDSLPVAKWAMGEMVQSKAGGPKLVVEAVHLPTRSAFDDLTIGTQDTLIAKSESEASGITYSCTWWTGNKRHKELFTEEGLQDSV